MTSTIDPIRSAGLVTREIRSSTRDGQPTRTAVARRWYAAERADVWDALTNAERIPRWFLPISGELVVDGRYQLEGNAGGVIETCREPENFAVTWEYGEQVSWLAVHLSDADEGTTLELLHEAHVDPDLWAQFGPGAVGIGWDLGLYGLDQHLTTGAAVDPAEAARWLAGPDGAAFVKMTGEDWGRAAVDDGDDPEAAQRAVENVVAMYTAPPDADPEGTADPDPEP